MHRTLIAGLAASAAALIQLPAHAQCAGDEQEYSRERIGNTIHVYCVQTVHLHRVRAIDAELTELGGKIDRDHDAVQKWQQQLPGYLEALDEWVKADEAARKATREKARDAIISAATARIVLHANTNIGEARGELDTLWAQYANSPLGSPRFSELLREQGHATGVIRKWQSYREMAETIDNMHTAYEGLDAAEKQKYAEAIIALMKSTIKDPRLNFLVDEVDFTATALLGNATAWTAQQRVDQLLQLGDDRLRALKSLSGSYKADIDKRNRLLSEKQTLVH